MVKGKAMRRKEIPIREIVYVPHQYEGVYSMLERNIISIKEAREFLQVNSQLDNLRRNKCQCQVEK
jgi:hypothetical protein